jgi:oxygen-independent coproporphyrinogen-3 oxidase
MRFGVYIHVPFCLRRCGYCDFASSAIDPGRIPHRRYVDALLTELGARAADHEELELSTIYLGGGTPTLLAVAELGRILGAIRTRFRPASTELEVTIEANPGTVDGARLAGLRAVGVNRLSLGVQSLDDRCLQLLGRIHDAAAARAAVREARAAGFARLSCDLIFGLPGQTLAHHLDQLRRLLELGPDHVSAYALSLSPESPLSRAGLEPAGDDLQAEMMEAGRELLESAGLPQYEVSSFAPPLERSRHNALCWSGHPYLGLGASAHSMLIRGAETLRIANPPIDRYLAAPTGAASLERVAEKASRNELLFLGLRTTDGVDRAFYAARFGADPLAHVGRAIRELAALGLLTVGETRIAPTRRGIWFADELALRLLACQNDRDGAVLPSPGDPRRDRP